MLIRNTLMSFAYNFNKRNNIHKTTSVQYYTDIFQICTSPVKNTPKERCVYTAYTVLYSMYRTYIPWWNFDKGVGFYIFHKLALEFYYHADPSLKTFILYVHNFRIIQKLLIFLIIHSVYIPRTGHIFLGIE